MRYIKLFNVSLSMLSMSTFLFLLMIYPALAQNIGSYKGQGLYFSPSPLIADVIELRQPKTIKIVGTTEKGELLIDKDTPVSFIEKYDKKTDIFTSKMVTHAINITWEFTETGISFEDNKIKYISQMPGATISFKKNGIQIKGFKKINIRNNTK